MDLPPRFDADSYLALNPDLAIERSEAAEHYDLIGRAEGRIASPLAMRENLIALVADGRSVLEIGPFYSPLLTGPHVAYLDMLDADQLRARAAQVGGTPETCPATIDYVGGLEQVTRRFDAVISSHAIEHQPDLIHHLDQVARILEPDGLFCLMIPDKRYCLDHHIAESTIADVLQAHRERRQVHALASVIEHVALTTHNDPARHWAGDHGPAVPPDLTARARHAGGLYESSGGGYVDVHAWYFTPDSFRTVIDTIEELGMARLEVAEIYDTMRGRNEFCAVLRLNAAARDHARRHPIDQAAAFEARSLDDGGPWFTPKDDRWESRLAHRDGLKPALVEAPTPAPDVALATRICAAWGAEPDTDSVAAHQRDFVDALRREDAAAVAGDVAGLGRSHIAQGFFGGTLQHSRAENRQFARRLARWTYDRLVSLAEAVGAIGVESPEQGRWGDNARHDPVDLFCAVERAIGVDLAPPAHIGGHLGIAAGDGLVLHMRMLDAIHAAWRLRQIADMTGRGDDVRIAEIGAGAGLTAYYAAKLGLRHYRLFDRSAMNAIQAYVLAGAGLDVALIGEPAGAISILPDARFAAQEPGSIDILFNADSLPAVGKREALAFLADAGRLGIRHLLSINPEYDAPDQAAMSDLVGEAGGYRLVARHRHWLRAGYVEELYAGTAAHIVAPRE